jgi:hypothetical protein
MAWRGLISIRRLAGNYELVSRPDCRAWRESIKDGAGSVNTLLLLQQFYVGTDFIGGGECEFHRLSVGAGRFIAANYRGG